MLGMKAIFWRGVIRRNDIPSHQESVPEISGILKSISVAKVIMTEVVIISNAEMLKALEKVEVVWHASYPIAGWLSGPVPLD